jgi:hypothetical protein
MGGGEKIEVFSITVNKNGHILLPLSPVPQGHEPEDP